MNRAPTKAQRAAQAKLDASYAAARAEAQKRADETGLDVGLEANTLFGTWTLHSLPAKRYRFGFERKCEVVSCSDLGRCIPGHGPTATY